MQDKYNREEGETCMVGHLS